MGKTKWRTEPTYPETCADDLWLAVKFQSNSDIAGSPRNRLRPSLEVEICEGRALNVRWPRLGVLNAIKLRMSCIILGSQRAGDNVRTRKEKSPRSPIKVPKSVLSGKGCGVVKTARRLAQKQPSFKECVIAH